MKRRFDDRDRKPAGNSWPRGSRAPESFQDATKSAATEIFRAMRLARGFERQKLGRRQKEAKERQSTDDIARIDREIVVLKAFDLAAMAEFYLYKTLLRIPSISTAPEFPDDIASNVARSTKPVDTDYLNVSARLFKSNAVSSALESSLRNLYEVLDVEPQVNRKKRLRKSDFQRGNSTTKPQTRDTGHNQDGHVAMSGHRSSDDHIARDAANSESEISPSISRDVSTRDSSEAPAQSSMDEYSHDGTDDGSTDKRSKPARATTTTSFLPSLAAGYISGSESEASDLEDLAVKKNRPGQRARQARAERKYGSDAAHLKKQRQSRDYGWDARKGAQEQPTKGSFKRNATRAGPPRRGGGINHGGHNHRSSTYAKRPAKSTNGEQQGHQAKQTPLHPSWEAAKKQKEQKSAAAFQGKKLVFD